MKKEWKDLDFFDKAMTFNMTLLSFAIVALVVAFITQLALCGCPISK